MALPVLQQILVAPFRLDDLTIYLLLAIGIGGCIAHFAKEVFLGRRVTMSTTMVGRVKHYDAVQIILHWLFLLCVALLFITGFIIFKMEDLLPAYPWVADVGLRMLVAYHWYFALILLAASLVHVIYDVVVLGKFSEANFTRLDLQNLVKITRNFLGSTKEYPVLEKYHPLQKLLHWSIFVVLFLLGFTGLTIWDPFSRFIEAVGLGYLEEWLYIYSSRYLHDLLTFIFVVLMIGHFYFSTLLPGNWKLFKGMITGWVNFGNPQTPRKEQKPESLNA